MFYRYSFEQLPVIVYEYVNQTVSIDMSIDSIKFPDDIYYLIYQNLELIFDICEHRIDGIICTNQNTLVEYTEEIMKIPILGIKINEEIIQYKLVDFIDESNNEMFKGKFHIKISKGGNN